MRILFMGTPEFAVPSLTAMLEHGEKVVAVVCQPDRPSGRGRKLSAPPVKIAALAAGLPVLQPAKIKTEEFLDALRSYRPDIIVVTAYGRILPETIINLPVHGTINVHASLLPKYRGAAPIQWAVINGEKQTGVTIMQMDAGLDTGDILLPGAINIADDDTAGSLAVKLSRLGGELLVEALQKIRKGLLRAVKQDDAAATLAPLLAKEDGHINWELPAVKIGCLIRGLDPWPSAYTFLNGERLRLFRPAIVEKDHDLQFGTVVKADKNGLLITTGEGLLSVAEIQKEGGRRMAVGDYLAGNPLRGGSVVG